MLRRYKSPRSGVRVCDRMMSNGNSVGDERPYSSMLPSLGSKTTFTEVHDDAPQRPHHSPRDAFDDAYHASEERRLHLRQSRLPPGPEEPRRDRMTYIGTRPITSMTTPARKWQPRVRYRTCRPAASTRRPRSGC